MDLVTMDLNNINLDDEDFDENDPETTTYVKLMDWCNKYNQHKAWKKKKRKDKNKLDEELMWCL